MTVPVINLGHCLVVTYLLIYPKTGSSCNECGLDGPRETLKTQDLIKVTFINSIYNIHSAEWQEAGSLDGGEYSFLGDIHRLVLWLSGVIFQEAG